MDLATLTVFFKNKEQLNSRTENGNFRVQQAAEVIQQWWRQTRLKQTAKDFSQYVNEVVSLKQAENKSFLKLQEFILDQNVQVITRKLLLHLEQAKDAIIPARSSHLNLHRPERVFLAAYLIATKPEYVFESPTTIDTLLLTQASDMLKSFEALCQFMGKTYMEKIPNQTSSPLTPTTPSSDQIFANIKAYKLALYKEKMKKDQRFMAEGQPYLEAFHQAQMAYYETFYQWESNNRSKLAKICITKYLQIESKRFAIFLNPDPRQIELYEEFGHQQEILHKKIKDLLGDDGLKMLEHELKETQEALETQKWMTVSPEVLLHELALNPEFTLPQEACAIHPQKDIDAALVDLTKNPIDVEPILDILEEIRDQIAFLTPNNKKRITDIQKTFSKETIILQLNLLGLEKGLYKVINELIEKIKELESPEHVPETIAFQRELEQEIRSGEHLDMALKKVIDFFYGKLSQINLEIHNTYINQTKALIASNIVKFEKEKFQKRLTGSQFNLANVLGWIDTIVTSPTNYRLGLQTLYSQHIASHITHAICIAMLQKPGNFNLHAIPETFYLDRSRLVAWHEKYQHIFYTATAIGCLKIFYQEYGENFSFKELLVQKEYLLANLKEKRVATPKEIAEQTILTFEALLIKKGKTLTDLEKTKRIQIIENACMGNHQVANIINKRLGDLLSFYFFKGYLPEFPSTQTRLHGLETDLGQLGQEILPLLRLHVKVHGDFYKRYVADRLWKPLFTILKNLKVPNILPPLLNSAPELISNAHAYIHKLAFLLSGLGLIQQTVVYADMWDLNAGIKYPILKNLACSYSLINEIYASNTSKAQMEQLLIQLMKDVADERDIPFDHADEQKFIKRLRLAKNGTFPGYKTFIDEFSKIYEQFITQEKKPDHNPNPLISAFLDEIKKMCSKVKEITDYIKEIHLDNDIDPVAQILPKLQTGRNIDNDDQRYNHP